MWPERLHDRITHHPGPTLIVAEALFGGSYLIASLSSERRPLIWLELASHDASDAVLLGNRLSAALTRALGSNLISKALPYPAVAAALRRDAPFLGPLTLAASGVHHAPDLARALLELHSPDLRVVLEAPHRPPGVALASEVLIVQPSDLALTHEEARQFAGDSLDLELEATEELLAATDGAYEPFTIALSERLGLPTPLRPGPEGPRFAPGTEPEVDPEALFDVLLERRRWLAALELAVSTLPDRTPQVLVRAGHTLNGSGLHGRMWELLEALPKTLRRHETVLFWRLAAAFRVGQLEAVLPEVRWHLERFEAPELRALHAGTTLAIIPTRLADRRVLLWAYLAIPLQYGFIYFNSYGMFLALVPVFLLLWLPMVMVLIGEAKGFLSAVGTLQWGAMITIFSISHLAFLPALPADLDTGLGLLLYLLLITELNDVAQYLWGKRFGRRKVLPSVSPSKSVEGLLGGVATTMVLSLLLGPLLTPMSWWLALAVGLLLAVAGFLGDLTVSALKRDLDLKDSGALIPGHGGILDRIDSLVYTAPLFFHIIRFVFFLPGSS